MKKLEITSDTPLNCTGLINGDYYFIHYYDEFVIAQLMEATILNVRFSVMISNGMIVDKEMIVTTISIVDNENLQIVHIGDTLSLNNAVVFYNGFCQGNNETISKD